MAIRGGFPGSYEECGCRSAPIGAGLNIEFSLISQNRQRVAPVHPMYALAPSESIEASTYHHGPSYLFVVNWGSAASWIKHLQPPCRPKQGNPGPLPGQRVVDLLHGGGTLFLNSRDSLLARGTPDYF